MSVLIERSERRPGEYRLTTTQHLDAPRDRVFAFFSDAFQLERLTPPWLSFSVRTPGPIDLSRGTLIDYKLRLHGLPLRWRSRIATWDPPRAFVDEQVHGPYRSWHHLHTFDERDGGTLVRDIVHYSVPLGFLLHPLLVGPDLRRIFEFRQATLGEIFRPAQAVALPAT